MKKKLTLNKEKITKLTAEQSLAVKGGKGSAGSSNHNFTCCLCTGGNEPVDTLRETDCLGPCGPVFNL